ACALPIYGLAGGGVHDVEPAGLAGLGDVAPPVQVEQDRRADRGEVPDVVGHGLEVPAQGAGLAVQGDDGGRVQVVAGPHPPVEAGRRVADAEVEGLGGGVVGGGHPDGAPAAFPGVPVGGAVLALRRDVPAE